MSESKPVHYKPSLGRFIKGLLQVDSRPTEAAVKFVKKPSMVDVIKEQLANERFKESLREQSTETFEQANDFYVPEDDDPPGSKYELDDETESPYHLQLASIDAYMSSLNPAERAMMEKMPVGDLLKQAFPQHAVKPERVPDDSPEPKVEKPSKGSKKPVESPGEKEGSGD